MINEVIVVLAVVERIQNQAVKEGSENIFTGYTLCGTYYTTPQK